MRKRKASSKREEDHVDDDEEEGSEMDVDAEEKMDTGDEDVQQPADEDDDEEEERDASAGRTSVDNAFLDSFYGLSSPDAMERAHAAHSLLNYCLLGSSANTKDAAYAFKRLLNGLCSGRAAARQGNASAMASFLKVSLEGGQMEEIRELVEGGQGHSSSILQYVRQRLVNATDPSQTQGKKKGSEERDYQFGRLFGILSVARSGVLLPTKGSDLDDVRDVTAAFVNDLVELHSMKKWMREPAAHAIVTLLNSFYDVCDKEKSAKDIVHHLVTQVVVPKMFFNELGKPPKVDEYSAEQIAIATIIQAHTKYHPKSLPAPLNVPILSLESVPGLAPVLKDTSSVTQPRMHLVWDAIWMFLTEELKETKDSKKASKSSRLGWRTIRKKLPLGHDSAAVLLESLIREVVLGQLLKVEHGKVVKTTHERRALALCIVRNLLGVEFPSSITGLTRIIPEPHVLESTVLTPVLVRRLFLDVVGAGSGGHHSAHPLKALALQILNLAVSSMLELSSEAEDMKTRQMAAQCLVRCEPRFDSLTKTTTVADLVGLSETSKANVGKLHMDMWDTYMATLEQQIVESGLPVSDDAEASTHLSLGYVDLMYSNAKRLLRLEFENDGDSSELHKYQSAVVRRVLGFFMAAAFFDCNDSSLASGGKKKDHVLAGAARLAQLTSSHSGANLLPYITRRDISDKFYSLLAVFFNATTHAQSVSDGQPASAHAKKDSIMLDILSDLCKGWKGIDAEGAKCFYTPSCPEKGPEDDEPQNLEAVVSLLEGLAKYSAKTEIGGSTDDSARTKKRCAAGFAILAQTLYLHLLSCGRPDDIMDEDDVPITTEDDEDLEEIADAMEELKEIAPLFLEASFDGEQNPLAGFAELCVGILSTRLSGGSSGQGSSPKLIREAVKFSWMGCLAASAQAKKSPLVDSDVISVLLSSIGVPDLEPMDEDGDQEEHDDDDESDDDDDSSPENDFSKAGMILDADDENDEADLVEDAKAQQEDEEGDDNEDVELDPDKLHSMLEEDSDADVDEGELEHHEGADAALGALIKMKQEARKAGQQAREKLEIAKQIRCTLLLETLSHRPDGWNSLFRSDLILGMIIPLLSYRSQLENSLGKITGKSHAADINLKKGFLDRLTSLLNTKVFKLKLANVPCSESVNFVEVAKETALQILDTARKSPSKDQLQCCSTALIMVLRALPEMKDILKVAAVYDGAVAEWSSKKKTRLEVSLFHELINHWPGVAQAVLIPPLASAAVSARLLFMKTECFHLLSLLYNAKINQQHSEVDTCGIEKAKKAAKTVVGSICVALKEDVEQKQMNRRIHEVFHATEKLLGFVKAFSVPPSSCDLKVLEDTLRDLKSKTEKKDIQSKMEKIVGMIEGIELTPAADPAEDDNDEETAAEGKKEKKKKEKKKKKKRGKK